MELTSFERQIEADLEWREAELAIFRELLATKRISRTRSQAMFRAAWALLYAHYEGFAKFYLDLYIEYICKNHAHCRLLPSCVFVFLIDKEIVKTRALSADSIYNFFLNEVESLKNGAPQAVQVDTRSNLWPDVLEGILIRLDLGKYDIVSQPNKLKTLVARRNDIAHGKKVFIDNFDYYEQYEMAAREVMYNLALAVVDRAGCFTKTKDS